MPKFTVYGKCTVAVYTEVEAESPEEAIELAYEECDSLDNYAGNGGTGKLVGTASPITSIEGGDIEYDEAEAV